MTLFPLFTLFVTGKMYFVEWLPRQALHFTKFRGRDLVLTTITSSVRTVVPSFNRNGFWYRVTFQLPFSRVAAGVKGIKSKIAGASKVHKSYSAISSRSMHSLTSNSVHFRSQLPREKNGLNPPDVWQRNRPPYVAPPVP